MGILGPTGGGKARLAAEVARRTRAHLLSCDSMKVYRGLDIGTAKPSVERRAGIDWHGIDVVPHWERFDAQQFRKLFDEIRGLAVSQKRPLLLSGGTMLYFKAATEGLDPAPPRDPGLRERLSAEARERGSPALHARLLEVDPDTAHRVHPNDLRRIVRALEVFELTARPVSSFHGRFGEVRPDIRRLVFVVERARDEMDERIDARVVRWMDQGWIEECRALARHPRGVSVEASQALGYRQIFAWIEAGEREPLEELVRRIQTATRRFARKQLTWIRKLKDARTLRLERGEDSARRAGAVIEALS